MQQSVARDKDGGPPVGKCLVIRMKEDVASGLAYEKALRFQERSLRRGEKKVIHILGFERIGGKGGTIGYIG